MCVCVCFKCIFDRVARALALSGPQFWGRVNPDWALCTQGRQQSPINIEPSRLLYDPNLKHLQLDSTLVGWRVHLHILLPSLVWAGGCLCFV